MNYLSRLERRLPEMMVLLEQSVNMDSPSADKALTDRLIGWYEERFREQLEAEVEGVPNELYGDRLALRIGSGPRRILLVAHADTVWTAGEAGRRPFRTDSKRAYGPGVYDMKASLIQALYPMKLVQAEGRMRDSLSIVLLINSDEEIGSPTSRAWIEAYAKESEAALVLEPPLEANGALKTARKSSGRFLLSVQGQAAHAGVNPEAGISAVEELARQIIRLHSWSDADRSIQINVGNFTAACGTPTLDGLGVGGGGAHSPSEYIWVHELSRRTALLAGILERV
ncbi:M20/M25/M40 family metallo-hydrolase [Paenibacillus thiaminolyticus]|uniref:M20/M25/M40 family metallo-hydrolase n=1 Tax=Paenibacillus thiaminolyticus TaxID=49283 RepID=A0A3A3G8M4_PANTH|nr:M20/M25/M40 family metallo-hydrolase [Paenibacillus thiaminolyticus]RJG15656.1 M20/M25/M40 family metallo-hydrolase [Paenibacillus thiaminolyticus]